jgi:ATP-dependent Lhr-like helicase
MPDGVALATGPLERWFADNGWKAFDFQREVWSAYLAGESGLVHSATGSGKTLAAFLGPVAERIAGGKAAGESMGSDSNFAKAAKWESDPLRVLWLTPMRALAADTKLSLERAVEGLGLPWTVGLRTGDTSSAERAKQARRLPSALVTTPESLSLLLSDPHAREKLSDLRLVVVDEWHELLGSKRGVMTELALARLRRWNAGLRIWGLSATLGNIEEALERLIPGADKRRVVEGTSEKQVAIDTLIPADVDRFPWAGHVGLAMLEEVVAAIDGARSTLVFTNVRSAAETWYQGHPRGTTRVGGTHRPAPRLARHRRAPLGGGRAQGRAPQGGGGDLEPGPGRGLLAGRSGCCRSAAPRAWRGSCSAPGAPGTHRGR